jgi:UDP-2-acetamido-3-amino-2,3-dideoxy-glucuronate N-acetyltransferase
MDSGDQLCESDSGSTKGKLNTMPTSLTTSPSGVRIHSTAIVEDDVQIGHGTSIWDNVHIRHAARIGAECIIGEKTYVAPGVRIGNRVKINAFVYVCSAVTIEDGVMVSAGVIFTNDRYPRAATSDLKQLRTSEPDEHTLATLVSEGASIGAGSRIGCGLVIGRFAMIGMGSVVTESIPAFTLVLGTPARCVGYVCRCGHPLLDFDNGLAPRVSELQCDVCGRPYHLRTGTISELVEPGRPS